MFNINVNAHTPIYKQLISEIERKIDNGELREGDCLPSMSELSTMLDISKETVKKVYSILRERGLVESLHGKGFFVTQWRESRRLRIFVLFDKLSQYKQVLYDAFAERIGDRAEMTMYIYNQDISTFEEFIDNALDRYDYYIVTPHLPLDPVMQARALKALKRIPNRKLIMLDHWMRSLQGHYGAVYQDMANDIYGGLSEALNDLRKYDKLHVVTLSNSLYGSLITAGVERFSTDKNIDVEFHYEINAEMLKKGGVYLLLNGQLGFGLVEIARYAKASGLAIGSDIGIISYNDSYLSEVILGGLTTVSTDFAQMGKLAAEMVISRNLEKIKCDFRITRRNTF
ncbi:MAG: GntR family transcriptional regulator [Alistipes sp.]|nr:GntR family transcriptional regulator [Alistipes sp.]